MAKVVDLGLMTRAEVVAALRMEHLKDPTAALYRLRMSRHLQGVRLGRAFMYRRADVERLVEQSVVES